MLKDLYHLGINIGDLGEYVFLPGDPGRTDLIAESLEDPVLIANNREYRSWNGKLNGTTVSVVSTGIGGPSAAIAIEELIMNGSHTFIRIGTAGRLSEDALDETVEGVISTAAVRDEGLTLEYVPETYPAVANRAVVSALVDAALGNNLNYIEGITHCKESYYGQTEPDRMPLNIELNRKLEVWKRANVACMEMESSTIFVLSSIFQKRAGSIMNFDDNMAGTIKVAIDAMKTLIENDK